MDWFDIDLTLGGVIQMKCVSYQTDSEQTNKQTNKNKQNIARGTTDPEIDSVTLIELGNNMALLALIANLVTRQHQLH